MSRRKRLKRGVAAYLAIGGALTLGAHLYGWLNGKPNAFSMIHAFFAHGEGTWGQMLSDCLWLLVVPALTWPFWLIVTLYQKLRG